MFRTIYFKDVDNRIFRKSRDRSLNKATLIRVSELFDEELYNNLYSMDKNCILTIEGLSFELGKTEPNYSLFSVHNNIPVFTRKTTDRTFQVYCPSARSSLSMLKDFKGEFTIETKDGIITKEEYLLLRELNK